MSADCLAAQSSPQERARCSSRGMMSTLSLRRKRERFTWTRPMHQACGIDAGGHSEGTALSGGAPEQSDHPFIAAIKGDEGACVEN